jgi:hypothetical protein
MTHDEAIEQSKNHLHLIGKEFLLADGELESIKAVVPWDEGEGNWQPHVCFYNWGEENPDGKITHMKIADFMKNFTVRVDPGRTSV